MNGLSKTERKVLRLLRSGNEADLAIEKRVDMTSYQEWGPDRTITARFIRLLCTDPDLNHALTPHGLRIRGARILNSIDLAGLQIPFKISLRECSIPDPVDFRHASVAALDLSGSWTGPIDADGLHVGGDMHLERGFWAAGPVCLLGADIKGNLSCVLGHFDNQTILQESAGINGCTDCRSSHLHNYALILERAKIEGSVHLCGGFKAEGGVHLGDARIALNVNCTKGAFTSAPLKLRETGKTNGRRLPCEADANHHHACAFNAEGVRVKGNLLLNEIAVCGEMRLTGAHIDGSLDSAAGTYENPGANAIHGDRLRVGGNIFFCDRFKAEGTIRLPRAEIGADLSMCRASLASPQEGSPLLHCEGIRAQGTVYLKEFCTADGWADFSYAAIGGNLNCTDGTFRGAEGWALKAKGMDVKGSVFMCSSGRGAGFRAEGVVGLTGSKIAMDVVCNNGKFKSKEVCASEPNTPCAIKANNMVVGGKVEMSGSFIADGGVSLDDTNVGSFLDCSKGTFRVPPHGGNDHCAISAGKLKVDGSIYLDGFTADGEVMLNDAVIGRNVNLNKSELHEAGGFALRALQAKVDGSVNARGCVSHGEIRIDHAVLGGNLDFSSSTLINPQPSGGEKAGNSEDEKGCALHAVGVKINGSAEFNKGFHADGIVTLKSAKIGIRLSWRGIDKPDKAALHLDSAKIGVLEDDEQSWPAKGNLQINGFEYAFLKDLGPEKLAARCKKWLTLPRDFRTQPFEHLAAVLKRNGYEEEARMVLIQKNDEESRLPVRWPWSKRGQGKIGEQSQSLRSRLWQVFLRLFVVYGYKPSRALIIGSAFILAGWLVFYNGFDKSLMVPVEKAGSYSHYLHQVGKLSVSNPTAAGGGETAVEKKTIKDGLGLYAFVYTLDTFVPILDFGTAGNWLPNSYPPQQEGCSGFGLFLCIYRWLLIACGWVVTSVYVAALSGLVRR